MVFHYFDGASGVPGLLGRVAYAYNVVVGSVGVDVFAFLSGFSMWHALSRVEGSGAARGLADFYVRRVRRVLVPYLVAGVLFWAAKDLLLLGLGLRRLASDLLFLTFVAEGVRTVWYVPFIMCAYLVAPLLYGAMRRGVPCAALVGIWVLLCVALWLWAPALFMRIEIALLRYPVFVVGMRYGQRACEGQDPPAWATAALAPSVAAQVACGFVSNPFKRLVSGVYAMLLVMACTWVCRVARERRRAHAGGRSHRLLVVAGQNSFELYLTHVMVRNLLGTAGFDVANPWCYAGCVAVSIPLAWALSLVAPARRR